MIDISDHARQIVSRLDAVDRASEAVDRPRAEKALMAHLAALDLPARPVIWAEDYTAAVKIIYRAAESAAWSAARSAAWSAAESAAWSAARSAAWSAAESAARSAAESAARSAAESAAWSAAWSAAESAAESAAWSAAESAAWSAAWSAAESADPAVTRTVGIWLPFVEATEAGLWLFWVTDAQIIAVGRPAMQIVGDRLHCTDGPAVAWPNGAKFWFWRGVQVGREIVENPSSITLAGIDAERNQERRRVLIERYRVGQPIAGAAAYLRDSGSLIEDQDERWGTLRRKKRRGDSDLLMLEVINRSPEPDGSFRHYFLRIHPELRPMLPEGGLGRPQNPTALNAVASTFGLTGEEYAKRIGALAECES